MKIWILQTGEPLPIDAGMPRGMRAMNLSQKLVDAGHDVVLWSSCFDHQKKVHRSKEYVRHKLENNYEIRLIPSPGYKKHIGVARLVDHALMARNLHSILKSETERPDIAFVGYPPIEMAFVISQWLVKKQVPFILDVKDLWPSMFVEVFPRPLQPIARVLFHPYFYLSKKAILSATSVSAMAPGFIDWVIKYSGRTKTPQDRVFRLTSPSETFAQDELEKSKSKWVEMGFKEGVPAVFFVGTFMSVFDFKPVVEALTELSRKKVDCQFILCGDGAYIEAVKSLFAGQRNVLFPGWIDRAMIEGLAAMSIASIAPYKDIDNFVHNTPNKIVDSLMLGKPILCPLSGEVENLIKNYDVGLTYGQAKPLSHCIDLLISNPRLQNDLSKNAETLYQKEFDYDKVYNSLVSHIEMLANSGGMRDLTH